MVAGTVVLSADRRQVLLISSAASPDRWVIPKGGMESDEAGAEASALRETWEEAGVLGQIARPLGVITDSRPPKTWKGQTVTDATSTWPPRSEFHFFELIFDRAEPVFPECRNRQRMWTTYADAIQKLAHRPELREAVMRSSLKHD
jgi:diphosphoinositol-polyphosphate diphosphatase